MDKKRQKAFENLNIQTGNKVILSLDGGGVRGILTLQLLKYLEKVAEIPCFELFDMVAGTSTGGIIASLIANGKTAKEIEKLYTQLSAKVFTKRSLLADRILNPPLYTKKYFKKFLEKQLHNATLKDLCSKTNTDILITARDVVSAEETFFTCFKTETFSGTYKDIEAKKVIEATMSAPTYFYPYKRFVDGGVTAYNNPAVASIIEAVRYCPQTKYNPKKLTVFSFGTGVRKMFVSEKNIQNPKGLDSVFWLKWLMNETGDDVSDMQTYLLRTKQLFQHLDFRRFQISLHKEIIDKLPNLKIIGKDFINTYLHSLTEKDLQHIDLDSVSQIPILKAIGKGMCKFIKKTYKNEKKLPPFGSDFINKQGKDYLIKRNKSIKQIERSFYLNNN